MVMFELTLFPLAFVMLPDISLDLCMSPLHFNFHLIFAWHFTWSLHFKMGFAIHLELYLVFHLIFSHRMMTFLTLTWDFICRDKALPWLLHCWVFPLAQGGDSQGRRWRGKLPGGIFLHLSIHIFMCIYIYAFMSQEWWCCKLTVLVQTFTWPTFHLTKYSLDGPFTEASNHLTNLFIWQGLHLTDLSLGQVFTWFSFHLTDFLLDKHPSLDTLAVWQSFHLRTISLDFFLIWITAGVFFFTWPVHLHSHWASSLVVHLIPCKLTFHSPVGI